MIELAGGTLYHGDCLEVMKDIPDNAIDMVLCDPPYGQTPCEWDHVIDFTLLWQSYQRIVKKNGAICIFGQEPYSSFVRLSNLSLYKYDWYWEKERLTNVFQANKRAGKTVETISVFYVEQCVYFPQKIRHIGKRVTNKIGKDARWSVTMAGHNQTTKPFEYHDDGTRLPTQVLRFRRDNPRERIHVTQKPVALCENLIKTYTQKGDMVLDNTIGS